jgi:eukaryotic-like serine/threonine-protein kinase
VPDADDGDGRRPGEGSRGPPSLRLRLGASYPSDAKMADDGRLRAPDAPLRVGRYLMFDAIASGGMATVHVGRLRGGAGFERIVAIKRLHQHLAGDPVLREMFVDEARLVSRITHPNVVQILDVETADDELFLVMEYVAGENLFVLQRGPSGGLVGVPPAIAAGIAVAMLHGLHAAHEARHDDGRPLELVHRDVAPTNILLGADGSPRICDFGVARAAVRVHQTRGTLMKGKLSYMAPEVLRGAVATRAVDIYAAGVVLWEMLTGRKLFTGDNDAAIIEQILTGYCHPPSRYAPGLPDALDEVVVRALRTAPSDRFASAKEMARAIEDALPVASPQEIGSWAVERVGPALASRARLVARIEQHAEAASIRPSSNPVVDPGDASSDARMVATADIRATLRSRGTTTRWVTGMTTLALFALVGLGFTTGHSAPSPESPAAPASSGTVATAADREMAVASDPSPPPPSTAGRSVPPRPAVVPAPPRRRRTPGGRARPGCDQPFTRDPEGTVHWKTECL